jgi:hypothetical protein
VETNPYAPPKTAVADLSSIGLKRRSVIVMIALSLVTFGFYYQIWFFRRRTALNQLDSPRKLALWPFIVATVWFAFQFIVGVARGLAGPGQLIGEGTALLFTVVRLAIGILMLVQCFFTKDILEDHFAGPGDQVAASSLFADTVRLSGVLTFFFQIFYLQYAINRYLADSKSTTV